MRVFFDVDLMNINIKECRFRGRNYENENEKSVMYTSACMCSTKEEEISLSKTNPCIVSKYIFVQSAFFKGK